MFKRLLPLVVLLGALLVRPTPAFACSCMLPPDPQTAVDQSQAVFVGTVTGIADSTPHPLIAWIQSFWPGVPPQMQNVQVTFDVTDSWKGVTATPITLRTGQGGGDCGYTFVPGGQYVVYAYADGGELLTSICSRTAETQSAPDDLNYLNSQPKLNLTAAAPSPTPFIVVGLAVVASAAVAATAWLVWRKH